MSQKNENCVHYPEPLGEDAHDNVFAFVEDIKQALVIDRILRMNKINFLANYLMRDTKNCILYCENLDAFDTLLKIFNMSRMIWIKKKEEFQNLLVKGMCEDLLNVPNEEVQLPDCKLHKGSQNVVQTE